VALAVLVAGIPDTASGSSPTQDPPAPEVRVYKTVGGVKLEAHIFRPVSAGTAPLPAAALFHGGGWIIGEPGWMAGAARRLAERGMVAVAIQYRLSDQKTVTPLDAMADARDAMRWLRRNADWLGLDPLRIAALGVSAGGHLALSAALFDRDTIGGGPPAAPDAFVLWYPALALARDRWVQRILLGRAPVASISPVEHVRPGLGPILILQGANDSLTPLADQREFCARVTAIGGHCTVQVYPGVGHLFMRNPWGEGDEPADSASRADAMARALRFLEGLGYLRASESSIK
jgi:acetyl esterase/lipase